MTTQVQIELKMTCEVLACTCYRLVYSIVTLIFTQCIDGWFSRFIPISNNISPSLRQRFTNKANGVETVCICKPKNVLELKLNSADIPNTVSPVQVTESLVRALVFFNESASEVIEGPLQL